MKAKKGKQAVPVKSKTQKSPPVLTVTVDSVALLFAFIAAAQNSGGDFVGSIDELLSNPQKGSLTGMTEKLKPFIKDSVFMAALCYAFDRLQKAREPEQLVSGSYFLYRLRIAQGKQPTRQQGAIIWKYAWRFAEQKKAVREAIDYCKKLDKGKKYSRAALSHLAQWKKQTQNKARSDFDYIFKKIQATVISKEASLLSID